MSRRGSTTVANPRSDVCCYLPEASAQNGFQRHRPMLAACCQSREPLRWADEATQPTEKLTTASCIRHTAQYSRSWHRQLQAGSDLSHATPCAGMPGCSVTPALSPASLNRTSRSYEYGSCANEGCCCSGSCLLTAAGNRWLRSTIGWACKFEKRGGAVQVAQGGEIDRGTQLLDCC